MDEHLVRFYDDDDFIVDEIWRFIGPGLRRGEAAVVIARREHLDRLEHRYAPSLLTDIVFRAQAGEFVRLDAEDLISRLIVNGWPDEKRFMAIVGDIMRGATRNGTRHVHAYGEMVGLLCERGSQPAAIRIEQLWNELAKELPFSLLCGYPMHAFSRPEDATAFSAICDQHVHVFPAEGYREGTDTDALHRTVARLQQKANALESEVARRKAIEHALHCREQELAELDRRKDEFIAMLGHELRNPLAPIMNSLELMRIHGDYPEAIARSRETITRQVALMARLVDDLLDVSRITRGTISLKIGDITLGEVIERAVEIARPLINERQHRLSLNIPADEVRLQGDPARLAQILANLLHNAAKYTDPGGSICMSARIDGEQMTFTIGDNGIGIDPALHEKVFDLFVQDKKSLSKANGGLGIGLTLVRSLVQLHGGTVNLRSEGLGKGSEFIVTLPLRVAPLGPAPTSSAVDNDRPDANVSRSILIVDDNIDAAESLGEILKVSGHRTHVVHDGPSALSLARLTRPEVVILDIGMPLMDGYRVAEHLRSDVGLTSSMLIAVTGYAQERDRMTAKDAGFDHHFAKPIDMNKLVEILNQQRPAQ